MKKFTRKQRAEIYLEAAEIVAEENIFACWAFNRIIGSANTDSIRSIFPEFALFEPTEYHELVWFNAILCGSYKCQPTRVLALLFAAEIAKHPIK